MSSKRSNFELNQLALALLDQLFELDSAERAQRLRVLRMENPELAAKIERLLAVDDSQDRRLDDGIDLSQAFASAAEHDPMLGRRVGPWQIVELIGRGGMGAVYRAERVDGQFEQTCALKLIRLGIDHPAARERFLRERQILARLRHPHIAALLDGGISEQQPWFAMELVDGERIDRWCDTQRLTSRDRVRLFLQVLDAVRYAHGKLIVHRDLKPSNILVTAGGQIKLLDFGVAKLVGGDESEDRPETRDYALTPEYAAPEQILGQPISTATDVYSLGLLLHVLLSGMHPFGPAMASGASLGRRLVLLDRDPEPLARSAAKLSPALAQARRASPKALARDLRGDLTAIVHRCLENEPSGRYASADALIDDLERWLDDRPVTARNGRLPYRSQRFVRRHRWSLAAGAAFTALIVGFAVNRQVQLERVQAERDNTEAVLGFFSETITFANTVKAGKPDITVREVTDLNLKRLEADRTLTPDIRGRLLATIGTTYTEIGQYEKGRQALEKAIESPDSAPFLKTYGIALLAVNRYQAGDRMAAMRHADQALALYERLPLQSATVPSYAGLLLLWVNLQIRIDDLERKAISATLQRHRLRIVDQGLPTLDLPARAQVLTTLAQAHISAFDKTQAGVLLEQALDIYRSREELDSPAARGARLARAQLLIANNDLRAAQREYAALIAELKGMHDPDLRNLGIVSVDYALVLDLLGRSEESIAPTEQALRILSAHGGDDGLDVLRLRASLAERLQRANQGERAQSVALDLRRRLEESRQPAKRIIYTRALAVLAEARLLEGSDREALDLIEQGQALLADLKSGQPQVNIAKRRLLGIQANICLLSADYVCAERSALAALAISSPGPSMTRSHLLLQRSLALAQLAQPGKQAEGRKLLDDVRAAAKSEYGECNGITLAAKYDPPITLADLASPPPPHCR